jgi:hypothetical protein
MKSLYPKSWSWHVMDWRRALDHMTYIGHTFDIVVADPPLAWVVETANSFRDLFCFAKRALILTATYLDAQEIIDVYDEGRGLITYTPRNSEVGWLVVQRL